MTTSFAKRTADSSVAYSQYHATPTGARMSAWSIARRVFGSLFRRIWFDTILYPYGMYRHKRLLKSADRSQGHTYTCFLRSPQQLEALCGPVLRHVQEALANRPLRILLFAGSNGAEAYTIASALLSRAPQVQFHIYASDLHQEMVDQAVIGSYSADEVLHSGNIDEQFIAATFERSGERFVVRPEVRRQVSFRQCDLLADNLLREFGPADIVICQNVLFHLAPQQAERAFHAVAACIAPVGALFVEGMDLPLKVSLTRRLGLQPLAFRVRDIHNHSRSHVGSSWWRFYYGSEPYCALRSDKDRRYGSIFLRGARSIIGG